MERAGRRPFAFRLSDPEVLDSATPGRLGKKGFSGTAVHQEIRVGRGRSHRLLEARLEFYDLQQVAEDKRLTSKEPENPDGSIAGFTRHPEDLGLVKFPKQWLASNVVPLKRPAAKRSSRSHLKPQTRRQKLFA
jgi:hypothetical protein